jgi:DNA-binding response OmpR family regulator
MRRAMATDTRRVLVAEDDESLRDLLTVALSQELGAAVDAVPDGRAALAALDDGAYALLLLDLMMPVTDGFAVLRWLAVRPPEARVPVVAFTAGSAAHRAEATRLGAAACVAKPFDLDELVAIVRPFLAPGAPGQPGSRPDAGRSCRPADHPARQEPGGGVE